MSNRIKAKIARGGKPNTLPRKTVPIIFVPGVMGSRLARPNGKAYWDPDNPSSLIGMLTASAGIQGIMFDADTAAVVMRDGCSEANLSPAETDRGWGGPAWGFYGLILREMQNQENWGGHNCNVYACGYDWRQSNANSGAQLKQFIPEVLGKEPGASKVIIVTHSMGGLVTRWACKNGAASRILGVVHVVQPAVGAVVAYRRYKTGARSGLGDGDMAFTGLLGNTAYKYQRISRGLKGPYELLPTNDHPPSPYNSTHWLTWDDGLKKSFAWPPRNIYDVYRDPTGRVGLFREADDAFTAKRIRRGIDGAESFHKGLGLYCHPLTYVVAVKGFETDAGTALETDWHLFGDDTAEVNEHLLGLSGRTYKAGDGTVPIGSQTVLKLPAERQHVFTAPESQRHAEVFESGDLRKKVTAFVNRILNSK